MTHDFWKTLFAWFVADAAPASCCQAPAVGGRFDDAAGRDVDSIFPDWADWIWRNVAGVVERRVRGVVCVFSAGLLPELCPGFRAGDAGHGQDRTGRFALEPGGSRPG